MTLSLFLSRIDNNLIEKGVIFLKKYKIKYKTIRRRGYYFLGGFLAVWVVGGSISCKPPQKKTSLIRLIDLCQKESVLRSPLLNLAPSTRKYAFWSEILGQFSSAFQEGSRDFSLLKIRLKVGQGETRALLAPPVTQLHFPVVICPGTYLEFTYGIRRDAVLLAKKIHRRRVTFEVNFIQDKRKINLFSRTLIATPEKAMVFNVKRLDLSRTVQGKGQLEFITRGDKPAVACWINPLIYQPDRSSRNVILISLDTLRADHLGCYGYSRPTSVAIDRLAAEGILFERCLAPSPWTLPSHVSLMTGLRTINHQVYGPKHRMSEQLETLAEFFSRAGWATTALTGGGYLHPVYGFGQGFDNYLIRGQVNDNQAAAVLAENVLHWLKRLQDRPFFMFIHTYQIHSPYWSPPPYNRLFLDEKFPWEKFDLTKMKLNQEGRFRPLTEIERQNIIALYDSEIVYTDEILIKPLLAQLKKLGLYERTLIVITSDHGEEFFEHQGWGHAHSLYNEILWVPLIIKPFGRQAPGRKVSQIVSLIDLWPTLLEAVGIKVKRNSADGETLWPLIKDQDQLRRVIISDLGSRLPARAIPMKVGLIFQDYKFIMNEPYQPADLKFFEFPPPPLPRLELYDLRHDFGESNNLAEKESQVVRRLLQLLNEHYRQRTSFVSEKATQDRRLQEQLRALGYLK